MIHKEWTTYALLIKILEKYNFLLFWGGRAAGPGGVKEGHIKANSKVEKSLFLSISYIEKALLLLWRMVQIWS